MPLRDVVVRSALPTQRALALIATVVLIAAPVRADETPSADRLTDDHVRQAIAALTDGLHGRRQTRHQWDPASWDNRTHGSATQAGGYTALAVLALLYAGESYQSPGLAEAVEHLATRDLGGTYAVAIRANVWSRLPPRFHDNLAADTTWLLEGFSEAVGSWTYAQKSTTTRRDNSIRQYGALALWEAAKRGLEIDRRYWQRIEEELIRCQLDDGGWNYRGDEAPATGSMTTAGLATLFITQDLLHAARAVRLGSVEPTRNEQAITRGLAWMDEHFSPHEHPVGLGSYNYFYYMYGVERVGLAGGLKHLGPHDWYREGAAEIIRRLCIWDEAAGTMTVHETMGGRGNGARIRVHDLAFGLMFLSRGRVPVAINKLRLPEGRWNNRPRDVANIARWLTDATERDLSWQIVEPSTEAEAWLDASLVYLASDRALPWLDAIDVDPAAYRRAVRTYLRDRRRGDASAGDASARSSLHAPPPAPELSPELRTLRRYLDLGGLLLAVNDGSSRSFAASIEKVGALLYPQYDWAPAPADHWAYTLHDAVPRRGRPALRTLSNGVRDLIVLSPAGDLSASFQGRPKAPVAHFQTLGNLYLYASEMNRPRPRLAVHAASADDLGPARRTVTVVRAIHGGNWKPEPLALEVFASRLAAGGELGLRLLDRPLADVADLSPRPALVLVSGIEPPVLTDAERQAMLRYVRDGGTMLFDTPGGRGEFTVGAEQVATMLFDTPVEPLVREAVITGAGLSGGHDLTRVEYRPFALEVFGTREQTPRLRGLVVDGNLRVLFSREDLSHGLLDQPRWGVSGYAPRSAQHLLENVVRYASPSSETSEY